MAFVSANNPDNPSEMVWVPDAPAPVSAPAPAAAPVITPSATAGGQVTPQTGMTWAQIAGYAPGQRGGSPEDQGGLNAAAPVNIPGVGEVHFTYGADGQPASANVLTPEGGMKYWTSPANGGISGGYVTPQQRQQALQNTDWTNTALGPLVALGIPALPALLAASGVGAAAAATTPGAGVAAPAALPEAAATEAAVSGAPAALPAASAELTAPLGVPSATTGITGAAGTGLGGAGVGQGLTLPGSLGGTATGLGLDSAAAGAGLTAGIAESAPSLASSLAPVTAGLTPAGVQAGATDLTVPGMATGTAPGTVGAPSAIGPGAGGLLNTAGLGPTDVGMTPGGAPATTTPTPGAPGAPSTAPVPSGVPKGLLPGGLGPLAGLLPAAAGAAGIAAGSKNAQKYYDQIMGIGKLQRDAATSMIETGQAGKAMPADQYAIDQWKNQAIVQAQQYYAKAGISDSTQLTGTIADINARATAMTQQAAQNLVTTGMNELNNLDKYQLAAVQAEMKADQGSAGQIQSFMTSLGNFINSPSGQSLFGSAVNAVTSPGATTSTTTPTTASTGASTPVTGDPNALAPTDISASDIGVGSAGGIADIQAPMVSVDPNTGALIDANTGAVLQGW